MKVIELLNKIANGEEVPNRIKYEKHIYEYEEGTYDWSYYIQNNGTIKFLLTDVFNSNDNILNILNNELEIIEEQKKIEKTKVYYYVSNDIENIDEVLFNNLCSIVENQRTQEDKLNEIINYINKENK